MCVFLIPFENDGAIIKIGHSYNIGDNLKALEREFKSEIFLIVIHCVNADTNEKEFHSLLKTRYPNNTYPAKKNTELYYLSHCIMIDHYNYVSTYEEVMILAQYIDDEINLIMKNQQIVFHNYVQTVSSHCEDILNHMEDYNYKAFKIGFVWSMKKRID
jgi:hypothetical protein